jgi:hypothetical protein
VRAGRPLRPDEVASLVASG